MACSDIEDATAFPKQCMCDNTHVHFVRPQTAPPEVTTNTTNHIPHTYDVYDRSQCAHFASTAFRDIDGDTVCFLHTDEYSKTETVL